MDLWKMVHRQSTGDNVPLAIGALTGRAGITYS